MISLLFSLIRSTRKPHFFPSDCPESAVQRIAKFRDRRAIAREKNVERKKEKERERYIFLGESYTVSVGANAISRTHVQQR